MRFDLVFTDDRLQVIYRSHVARTLSEAWQFARESAPSVREFHCLGDTYTVEVRSLALIPHPEEYQGPRDPEWERLCSRLRDEYLIERVRDWIDGYTIAYEAMRRSAFGEHATFPAQLCDYHLVRQELIGRGYEPSLAQRIALAATAPPHAFYEPDLLIRRAPL